MLFFVLYAFDFEKRKIFTVPDAKNYLRTKIVTVGFKSCNSIKGPQLFSSPQKEHYEPILDSVILFITVLNKSYKHVTKISLMLIYYLNLNIVIDFEKREF